MKSLLNTYTEMIVSSDEVRVLIFFSDIVIHVSAGTTSSVSNSIFDPLRDNQLVYDSEINKEWETLMISGPIIVGYMSNLMVLSSKQDFPFKVPAGYAYQYIKLALKKSFYRSVNVFLQISGFISHYTCSNVE